MSAKSKTSRSGDLRTRRVIIGRLKRDGPQDAQSIAEDLGVTAMAVRQHLYALSKEKLVTFETEARSIGRPAKLWRLTSEADRFFPDGHAELTVGLIGALGSTFGSQGMERLLAARTKAQIKAYRSQIPRDASLRRRLNALAKIRTREGYMAEVLRSEEGDLLFVENHCPICAAATACTGLCDSELDVFQAVLGRGAQITRDEHIIAGARRCAYRVAERKLRTSTRRGKRKDR